MATAISRRVALLEQRQPCKPLPCAYPSEAAARAAGATGGWLMIGPTMASDEWAAAAQLQQAELIKDTYENA